MERCGPAGRSYAGHRIIASSRKQALYERRRPDGKIAPNYDPAIGLPLQQGPIEDIVLWPLWDQIRCPVLVLRGAQSDVLMRETAEEMTRRGPRAELPDCGHVPALMNDEQIRVIEHWLDGEKT